MKIRQAVMAMAVAAALGLAGSAGAALTKDQMKAEKDRKIGRASCRERV